MEEKLLISHILDRQFYFEKERKSVEKEWKRIAEYVIPRYEYSFQDYSIAHTQKTLGKKIYNGMPVNAGRLLVDGLFGYLVSPNLRWMRLAMRNRELEDFPEVKTWLQECEEQLYYCFRSGFYAAIHEFFEMGCKLGTAFMYIEEDIGKGKIVYNTRDISELFIAENRFREVDTLHRKFKLAAREAIKKFPEKDLSAPLVRDAKSKDLKDNPYPFLQIIYPNEDKVYGKLDATNKEFWTGYVQIDGKKKILAESGYNKFPGAVWRWRKQLNTPWGVGPAHDALIDIMLLNQIRKDETKAIHLGVDPAYNVPIDAETVRIVPGGINRFTDGKKIITAIHVPTRVDASFALEKELEAQIQKHFMVEFFLMISQQENQRRTATEIMELAGEKAAVMGAVIGNLSDECLNPIIDRVFTIELNAGRLPPSPPMIEGEELEVDYMGPIAQAQKRWLESQGIEQAMLLASPIFQMFPDTMDVINPDKVVKTLLHSVGFPQEGIRSEDEIEKLREAKAEQLEKMQQMEEIQRTAEIVPKLSKKVEAGSVMEQMKAGK